MMPCPVCRATRDDAHKLDCPRSGKGPTVPATFDGETFELRLGEAARLQCDAPNELRECLELRTWERDRAEARVLELEAGIRRYKAAWEAIGSEVDYRHELNVAERALWALVTLEPIRAVVP